ncbi:AzlD family protein [Microvirga alba]|uniref:AzlD domain-containing protein n=1 Tax=Microvirga alba TaxID=2791025 RepID=A0A931FTU1_9HYPH|nr:AzlD domain-containing protein [Microvirga alba]MBF9234996.1 AzlD domain-containing protein [Microvirga alba]
MTAIDTLIAGPWGATFAIAAMTVATFLCRIAGMVVMSRVRITPRVERGLRALPGSIILATILPVVLDNGVPAILALSATILAMVLTRLELVGLAAGLGTLSIIRLFGW